MDTIRLHGGHFANDGTDSCDFRGDNYIGHQQGDEHRTLIELDADGTLTFTTPIEPIKAHIRLGQDDFERLVAATLTYGPLINARLRTASLEFPLLGTVSARIGVWDKDAPRSSLRHSTSDAATAPSGPTIGAPSEQPAIGESDDDDDNA